MSGNPADSLRRETACPFCDRIEFNEYEAVARNRQGDAIVAAFEPLNPVVPGHRLFLPVEHVASAIASPDACALAMREAAAYARWRGADCNLITSSGTFATQTVQHLHVHYVPRARDDGLALPWSVTAAAAVEAARADERARIAEAIESRLVSPCNDAYDGGWNDAMRTAAGEARAVSDGN